MSSYGSIPAGTAPADARKDASFGAPFTLADLLRLASARRRLIFQVALAAVALAAVLLAMLPTVYSATAVVLIDQRKNAVADASAVLSSLPTDPASVQNQIQILTSRDLAGAVVDKLDLVDDPEFNPVLASGPGATLSSLRRLINPLKWFAPTPEPGTDAAAAQERADVIDNLLNGLSVDAVGLSTSISVRYRARSAEKAARVANAFAESYVDQQVQIKAEAARHATRWLAGRVAQLSDQVQAAETAVEQYKADHNLNQSADGTSLTEQQLAAINTQLVQARADLAAKEATYSRVRTLIATGHVADVSQVVASPLIVQLRTQESTLLQQEADLATRYGPRHPKLIAVQSQRRDLEAKLKEEVDRVAGSLENDVAVARAQVASLNASLHGTEKDAATQNLATVKLKALQADAASTQSMYQAFVTRLRQTQDQESIQMSDARVISPAPVPNAPSSPNRAILLVASIPAGLLLGVMAALVAERFGLGGVSLAPMRQAPAQTRFVPAPVSGPPEPPPLLARIPDAASIRAADYVVDWPHSGFAQGMGGLMRSIAWPASGMRPRVIAVTAPAAEEGKTAIALGLARTAARAGWRTVLVDGDLARAPSARTLGYRAATLGLVDGLRGSTPLSRCFLPDPRSSLLALSNFSPLANPYGVLASPVMDRLFAHLRGSADLVVVDATPLTELNETHALIRHADAVVLVADPRRTSPDAIIRAGTTLAAMQARSVGLVLAG